MPGFHRPYPAEYREHILELFRRTGRSPEDLAQEFEPSATVIRKWIKQSQRDRGERSDGLTTDEREELRRLRRKVRRLEMEREILGKAAAWFAREAESIPKRDSDS